MSQPLYQIQQCLNAACRFRFPVTAGAIEAASCPRCGGPTAVPGSPFAGHEVKMAGMKGQTPPPTAVPSLSALLDNIRSIYNVGSLFRSADGVGMDHLYLCGITATPDHPKMAKTALGAELAVSWSYHPNALDTAVARQQEGYRLWALEGGPRAVSLLDARRELSGPPIVLVAGNEVAGIDPELLQLCDRVFYLPMLGVKGSLNVATAFGIAAYWLRFG